MQERCCLWCGVVFAPVNGVQRYCCKKHAMLGKRRNEREKKRAKKVDLSNMAQIAIISDKASEVGLSYGEYVAKYGE